MEGGSNSEFPYYIYMYGTLINNWSISQCIPFRACCGNIHLQPVVAIITFTACCGNITFTSDSGNYITFKDYDENNITFSACWDTTNGFKENT